MFNESQSQLLPVNGSRIESPSEKCGFCMASEIGGTPDFQKLYEFSDVLKIPKFPSKFLVIQNNAPIAENGAHLLLIPKPVGKGHDISLAFVEDQKQLEEARNLTINFLKKNFPNTPILAFEHGPGFIEGEQIACGGCHLDHAHGHFLIMPEGTELKPIKEYMENALLNNGWQSPSENAVSTSELFTNLFGTVNIAPYLQIGMINPNNSIKAFTYTQKSRSHNIESQLLRRVVSEVVYRQSDRSFWDWRDIVDGLSPDRLEQTKKDVAAFWRGIKLE